MNESKNIPTDEEFERASQQMREGSRNLDRVREMVLQTFKGKYPLHDFFIMDQRDVDFRAYVFFKENKDVEESRHSHIDQEIIECVYAELERAGRGKKNEIKVAFEFDSDENVEAKFEGDYYLRLR